MRIICKIIHWVIRIAFLITAFNCSDALPENIGILAIIEPIVTLLSFLRYETDEIIPVVTGFSGDNLIGFFDYNDNLGLRIFGLFLAATGLIMRCAMAYYLVLYHFNFDILTWIDTLL